MWFMCAFQYNALYYMPHTIWIIDDDTSILEVTHIVLQEAGYEVKVVHTIATLDESLQEEKPDLILLDIRMSGYNGADIARKLKANPATADILIVLMSADTHIENISKEAGADSYIRKPFDIFELEELVKSLLPA